MPKKIKIWSSAVADKRFREWIYERDGYKCVICGRRQSDGWRMNPSHFWGRRASATRYHPDNVDCFCGKCHMDWEEQKQGKYRDWKIAQLGPERYKELEDSFYQKSTTRRDEILKLMEFLTPNIPS